MSKRVYLIDANIFLTPIKNNYYNFNIAPSYWTQFNTFAEIKIPNVCEDVNIRCIDLFTMMEELKIVL